VCYWAAVAKWRSRRRASEPFGEREFYLEEFRGQSVLIAVSPAVVDEREPLGPLAATVADLVRNQTRVIVWWPGIDAAAERRLRAALDRERAGGRRPPGRRRLSLVARLKAADLAAPDAEHRLRAAVWARLRAGRLCVLAVDGNGFPRHPLEIAAGLRVPKVVLLEADGGLSVGGAPLSFVDENVLETLLRQGQAEWSGLGDRRALLVAVRAALQAGVEAVNLCALEAIGEELFTYVGAGTLFTKDAYTQVGPLSLEEFAQAERLLARGQQAGFLKRRTPEETAQVLAAGFGVSMSGRHLAGVAGLLTTPYLDDNAGEIVGLFTITRFKGEGLGERLLAQILQRAATLGLAYVFAVTIDERAQEFFERNGFERVDADGVPASKWHGYDPRRRERVVTFRRRLAVRSVAEASG